MRTYLSIFSLLIAFSTASAQGFHWEPTHGPATDAAWMLLVNGNGDIVAGSTNAIVRSTDQGQHWLPLPNSSGIVPRFPVFASLPDGHIIVGNKRINGDGSGSPVTLPIPASDVLYADRFGNLYANLFSATSFSRSFDEGNTWTKINAPAGETLNCIGVDAQHYYAGTATGIYFSSDSGTTWRRELNDLPRGNYAEIETGPNGSVWTLMASETGVSNSLYRSNDFGQTWKQIASDLRSPFYDHTIAVKNDTQALLSGNGAVFFIDDSTVTPLYFAPTNGGDAPEFNISCVDSSGDWLESGGYDDSKEGNSLFTSTVFLSTDDSASIWTPIPAPFSSVTALTSANKTLFATQALGTFVLGDSGNWSLESATVVPNIVGDPFDNGLLGSAGGGGVDRSTDGGVTWTNIFPSAPSGTMFAVATAARILFAGSQGVYVTTDDGSTWNETNDAAVIGTVTGIAYYLGSIYVSTTNGLFVSTNSGNAWTAITPTGASAIASLHVGNDGTIAFLSNNTMFRSDDRGATWQTIANISSGGFALSGSGDIFAPAPSGVVYWPNGSTKTFSLNDSLQGQSVSALALASDGTLYAAVPGLGVWKGVGDLALANVKASQSSIIASPNPAFPNPASTNVRISLPFVGNWNVTARDALGREVTMPYKTTGTEAVCDVSTLVPGAYQIELQLGTERFGTRVDVVR
ncbi:MAG TPA: hypothetical protein VGM92_12860 [Candidatus Kapabacteria bacterium]|jgi:photosystem II stability/assembly factor-like uncharacterized protein